MQRKNPTQVVGFEAELCRQMFVDERHEMVGAISQYPFEFGRFVPANVRGIEVFAELRANFFACLSGGAFCADISVFIFHEDITVHHERRSSVIRTMLEEDRIYPGVPGAKINLERIDIIHDFLQQFSRFFRSLTGG